MQAACVVTCGVVVWCGAAASRTDGAVPVQACRCTRAERTEHRAVAATAPPASGQAPQSPSPLSSRARSPSPVVVASAAGRVWNRRPAMRQQLPGRCSVRLDSPWKPHGLYVCALDGERRAPAARPPWRSAAKTWSSARRRGRPPFTGVSDGRVLRCGCRRSGAGPSTPAPRQTCKSRRRRPLRVITVRSFHAPPCLSRVTLLVPNQPCGSRLTVVCRPPPSK